MFRELLLIFLCQCLFGKEQLCKETDSYQQSFAVHVVRTIRLIISYDIFRTHKLHQQSFIEIDEVLGTYDLLTKQMQDKNHFGLEVIWVVDYVNALKHLLLSFFVLLWTCLLEYLKQFFRLTIFRVGKQELDCVTKKV